MKKKIIGILIILIGIVLLGGSIYIYFYTDLIVPRSSGSDDVVQDDSVKKGSVQNDNNTNNKVISTPTIKKIDVSDDNGSKTKGNSNNTMNVSPGVVSKSDLENIASSFAERFGSYSNQSNFSNLTDLKMFMGDKMRDWVDSYIEEHRIKSSASDIYYGIITKAVAQEIKEYDDNAGVVEILVNTRRRESIGSSSNSTNAFSQDITITFHKERGAWKVYSAIWQDR